MPTYSKADLLGELHAERSLIAHAFNLSYVSQVCDWRPELAQYSLNPGAIEFNLDGSSFEYTIRRPADLVQIYTPEVLNEAWTGLIKLALRNAVSQSYEAISTRAKTRNDWQLKWESAKWRPLARLLRNSFSHDFVLDFWDRKKKCLRPDVNYTFANGRSVLISNTEHGRLLDGTLMAIDVVPQLLDEMRRFVEADL
jgi:hypothetical protein